MALMLRAALGLEPWGVFTYGLIQHVPMSYGQMVVASSFVILLLWIPLRQWPGLGHRRQRRRRGGRDRPHAPGGAAHRGARLAGPRHARRDRRQRRRRRDVHRQPARPRPAGRPDDRPGPPDRSLDPARAHLPRGDRRRRSASSSEASSGVGTVLYALLIGPVVQFFLPLLTVRVERPERLGTCRRRRLSRRRRGRRAGPRDPRQA